MHMSINSTKSNGATGYVGSDLLSVSQWDSIARRLRFSRRETEVVRYIFEGLKESAIAYHLGISAHTVHTHIERIYRKIGVGSRCGLLTRVFAAYLSIEHNHTPATTPQVGIAT